MTYKYFKKIIYLDSLAIETQFLVKIKIEFEIFNKKYLKVVNLSTTGP